MTAGAIAALVAAREVSPAEVVRACLEALDADGTNAVVVRRDGAVLAEAQALERNVAAGRAGPLAGVPFTVKSTLRVAGITATAGSRLLRDEPPSTRDAPVVERLRRAGALLVGTTNCAEFALTPVAGNALHGQTLNPRARALSAGGSSCGCAAAVAGGLVPLSIGTDYGGSVRFPASCTGIAGFRPGLGSLPTNGQVPMPPAGSPRAMSSVPGPLLRSAADLQLVAAVLLDPPARIEARVDDVSVAVVRDAGARPLDAAVAAALESAASAMRTAGLAVDHIDTRFVRECEDVFAAIRAGDGLDDIRSLARGREDELSAAMRIVLARPPDGAARESRAARAGRGALVERIATLMGRHPVLVLPVATGPAPAALDSERAGESDVAELFAMLAPSRAVTLLGLPALAVPTNAHAGGIPVGVQLVCRRGDEGRLFTVARALEA